MPIQASMRAAAEVLTPTQTGDRSGGNQGILSELEVQQRKQHLFVGPRFGFRCKVFIL